jgi:hypothetical protein
METIPFAGFPASEYKEAQKLIYGSELMTLAEKIAFFPKFKIAIFRVLFNGNDPICRFSGSRIQRSPKTYL